MRLDAVGSALGWPGAPAPARSPRSVLTHTTRSWSCGPLEPWAGHLISNSDGSVVPFPTTLALFFLVKKLSKKKRRSFRLGIISNLLKSYREKVNSRAGAPSAQTSSAYPPPHAPVCVHTCICVCVSADAGTHDSWGTRGRRRGLLSEGASCEDAVGRGPWAGVRAGSVW